MTEVHWRALLAPLGKPDAAGRKINMGGTAKHRRLPLPFRYAPADWGGHAGAVSVGSIDRVWLAGGSLWGEGRFDLLDKTTQEVIRKVKNSFVRHVSVDIEPSTHKLLAATIVDIPAFEDAEIKSIYIPDDLSSMEDAPEPELELMQFRFRVVGDMDLPFADEGREWDSSAAVSRVFEWAGGADGLDVNRFRRAFFYQNEDADPETKAAYKLPFADVVDGELVAVPRAIFAVAGGHGVDAANIPDSDKVTIRRRVAALYRKLGRTSPWEMAVSNVERYAVAQRVARRAIALTNAGV